ncbi:hypothetical protein HDU67_001239, partial [Dinochytrium kinnereticum]
MAFDLAPVDLTMLIATFLFVPMGIISLKEEGMLTVMNVFAVAAGIEKTGCLEALRHFLTFGLKKKVAAAANDLEKASKEHALSLRGILYRLIGFLNNT